MVTYLIKYCTRWFLLLCLDGIAVCRVCQAEPTRRYSVDLMESQCLVTDDSNERKLAYGPSQAFKNRVPSASHCAKRPKQVICNRYHGFCQISKCTIEGLSVQSNCAKINFTALNKCQGDLLCLALCEIDRADRVRVQLYQM